MLDNLVQEKLVGRAWRLNRVSRVGSEGNFKQIKG